MSGEGFASGSTQEVCCDGGGGSWGGNGDGVCVNCDSSYNTTCNPCFPDEDTTAAINDAIKNGGFLTCMGYGTDLYRTFDGMNYAFAGECSYIAYNHGSRTFSVNMENCDDCESCVKVIPWH